MDLQKVRFYINPDRIGNLSELLSLFQILTAKKFSDLEYDAVKNNGLGIEDSLLVITMDHFEIMLAQFRSSLNNVIYEGRNKILVLGTMDSENLWRFKLLQKYGDYINSLPNVFRTSDTPTPINPRTALSVHPIFLVRVDRQGLHLVDREITDRRNFFCLMNRRCPHRDELMLAFRNHDLINKGLVVYHGFNQDPGKFPGLHYQRQFSDLANFNPVTNEEWKDYKINRYYNEYHMEIVTETEFDFISPTEKIMKPIIAGMPFLVVGSPGLLRYMQELGFRTYTEFFDESYNDEPDMTKQCDMVCKLLKDLIDNNALEGIYRSSQHIVDHNREILVKLHAGYHSQQFNSILEYIKRI